MVPRLERFHADRRATEQLLADFLDTEPNIARDVIIRSGGGGSKAALERVDDRVVQVKNAWEFHIINEDMLPSTVTSFLKLSALAKTARRLHFGSSLIDAETLAQADKNASDALYDLKKAWAIIIFTTRALPTHIQEEHKVSPDLNNKVTLPPTYDQIMHQLRYGSSPYLRSKDDDHAFLAELQELHIL